MRYMITATALSALFMLPFSTIGSAQDSEAADRVFDSESAILDTAIPFAIGARQAEQNLRGAFGWATFQEGIVEGVYFRFDPDGYARFSTSPRLDTDVFEVICRPRTYRCQARKGGLLVLLDDRGRIQLKFEQIATGDKLIIAEGVSELEMPERILQPLDQRLEALLTAGGDLVVRRGDKVVSSTSLQGFSAVVAYLRWVSARQDYTVLPRDWPVPNSKSETNAITQTSDWTSPMPQPQRIVANSTYTDPQEPMVEALADEVVQLREELKGQVSDDSASAPAIAEKDLDFAERLAKLELGYEYLKADIGSLRDAVSAFRERDAIGTDPLKHALPGQRAAVQDAPFDGNEAPSVQSPIADALSAALGLEPEVAAVLAAKIDGQNNSSSDAAVPSISSKAQSGTVLLEDDIVRQILNGVDTTTPMLSPGTPVQEYETLSEYLNRVMLGQ